MEFDPVVALQEIFPGADPQLLRGYLEASENVLYAAIRSFRDYLASDSATTSAGTSTSGGMADMTAKEASGSPQGGLRCRSWTGACCGAGSPWSSGRTTCRRSSQRRRGTPRSWTRRCRSSTGWTRPTTCSSTPSATSSQWMGGGCPHGSGVSDLGIHKEERRQPRTRPLVLLILLGRTCCLFHVGYMTAMVHMSVVEDMVFFLVRPSIG